MTVDRIGRSPTSKPLIDSVEDVAPSGQLGCDEEQFLRAIDVQRRP
jgi:hypothetical protein